MSQVLIPAEYEQTQMAVEERVQNAEFISISADGWSDVCSNSIINVIAHVPEPFLIISIDTENNRHTAEYIAEILSQEIERVGPEKVIGLITDNAANMKAAWRILQQKYPWLLCYGCKNHIFHLTTKDICSIEPVKELIKESKDLADFFGLLVEKVSKINYIGHLRALSSKDKSVPEEPEDAFNSSDEELIIVEDDTSNPLLYSHM
uniref:DUF659 domain-containing protein n=1 Tax=Acrobeloides nanus TaxID=290746 RepID=A0A914D7Z1_9BILA